MIAIDFLRTRESVTVPIDCKLTLFLQKNQTKADEQTIKVYPHGGEKGIAISSKTIDFRAEVYCRGNTVLIAGWRYALVCSR